MIRFTVITVLLSLSAVANSQVCDETQISWLEKLVQEDQLLSSGNEMKLKKFVGHDYPNFCEVSYSGIAYKIYVDSPENPNFIVQKEPFSELNFYGLFKKGI